MSQFCRSMTRASAARYDGDNFQSFFWRGRRFLKYNFSRPRLSVSCGSLCIIQWIRLVVSPTLVFNPYPWILKKKIQNVGPSPSRGPSVFCGKKSRAQHLKKIFKKIWIWIFFSRKHARPRSQKMAYIFLQHGIFPLILAYAIWNLHHSIAQLTLYLYI